MPTDPNKAAIDEAANTLQIAVLLAARIAIDQDELRRALTRAARSLATCAPTQKDR